MQGRRATVKRRPSIKGALLARVMRAPLRQQTPPSLNTKGQDLTAYSRDGSMSSTFSWGALAAAGSGVAAVASAGAVAISWSAVNVPSTS